MPSIINASNSTGLTLTSDLSGVLQLQQNGVALPALSVAPAFSAYLSSAQTINNNSSTKMALNTETFDTNNNYDTTNYRFTPTVAGYYQINGTVYFLNPNVYNCVFIWKNGARYRTGVQAGNGAYSYGSTVSDIVFMNGTTDYIELYCYQQSGSSQGLVTDAGTNFMSGCLIRGA